MKQAPDILKQGAGKNKRWLVPKLLVTLVLLAFAFSAVDLSGALSVLTALPLWAWCATIALIIGQLPQQAARWILLLGASARPLAFGRATACTFTGYFFSQALPTSVGGDVIRAYQARGKSLPFITSLASALLERISGLVLLILFGMLLLPEEPIPLVGGLDHRHLVWLTGAAAIAGLLVLTLIAHVLPPSSDRGHVTRFLGEISGQFRSLLGDWKALVSVLLLGASSSLTGAVAFMVAVLTLDIPLTFLQVLGATSLAIVLTVVPVSIAGWGIRENVLIWLLVPLGTTPETALGLSIWFGLASLLAAVPGALVWLKSR